MCAISVPSTKVQTRGPGAEVGPGQVGLPVWRRTLARPDRSSSSTRDRPEAAEQSGKEGGRMFPYSGEMHGILGL